MDEHAGDHPHAAFKSHRLVEVADGVVTVNAEVYPGRIDVRDRHRPPARPPRGIETTMTGGPFDGARVTHTYTPIGDRTKVDLEGDFPTLPGMSEADVLAMIDEFVTIVFAEDTVTLRTWSPAD